jgi:hypothetical protein
MKMIHILLTASTLMATALVPVIAADSKDTKRELLSKHETVAQFENVQYQQCRGMTALCPDRCGNSGDFATFKVVKYLKYEKPGQYGDPKQDQFIFQVEDNMKSQKVSAEIAKTVKGLKKGDFVLLDWQHDYVTKDGASSPERPIVKLKSITREEADKLTKN